MRRFSACFVSLHGVSKRSTTVIGQLVPLLLSFPCFKASHFFFKLAYALNQRRLRRLCGEEFFLQFYDRRVATGSVIDVLKSLRNIKCGLDGAQASNRFTNHRNLLATRASLTANSERASV